MALIHDIGESLIGDITPSDGISKEAKYDREKLAIEYLAIEAGAFGPEILRLWLEFEERKTAEAQAVFDLDRLDCMMQLFEYEKRDLISQDIAMFEGELRRISTPEIQNWAKDLRKTREEFFINRGGNDIVIFVIGPPGSGKSTQCTQLAKELGFHYISAGDLLREERDRPESVYSELITKHMSIPYPVPAQLTVKLLHHKMKAAKASSEQTKFLIDGFPRSVEQAREFEKKIQRNNYTFSMQCDPEISLERLEKRGLTSGRSDDERETRLRRVAAFSEQNSDVEQYLNKQHHFHIIDAGDNQVYSRMKDLATCVSGISMK